MVIILKDCLNVKTSPFYSPALMKSFKPAVDTGWIGICGKLKIPVLIAIFINNAIHHCQNQSALLTQHLLQYLMRPDLTKPFNMVPVIIQDLLEQEFSV